MCAIGVFLHFRDQPSTPSKYVAVQQGDDGTDDEIEELVEGTNIRIGDDDELEVADERCVK